MVGEIQVQVARNDSALGQLGRDHAQWFDELAGAVRSADGERAQEHAQVIEVLRFVHARAARQRERLQVLRTEAGYQDPYREPDPLLSVVIPTYDNYRLLCERAIPSVLAQTYQHFEVVVVGDGAPDEARAEVERFEDPRIHFFNRGYRGPYPSDPVLRWLVAGVPPYNEAVHRASGLWIAPLDDDDAFRPEHLEELLERARGQRLEMAYSRICWHAPSGPPRTIGRFPPELTQFGLQSAIYHHGLGPIFELELADAALGLPYDWAVCQRMMEAGVRIGMLESETVDQFPSRLWKPRWLEHGRRDGIGGATEVSRSGRDYPVPAVTPPEWEFVPEGWDRARDRAEACSVGWNVGEVAAAYTEKWPRFLEAVAGSGPLGVNHEVLAGEAIACDDVYTHNTNMSFGFALARAAREVTSLSILDWGGALGHHYILARQLLPDLSIEYHCRELSAVCVEGRRLSHDITFHDTDACLAREYDFVLASSSLHYAEDWYSLLRQLAGAASTWLFVTRVPTCRDVPSFVLLQRAQPYGYGCDTEYLGWVLNRDELLSAARDAGMTLVREFALLPPLRVPGAPEDHRHDGYLFEANVTDA